MNQITDKQAEFIRSLAAKIEARRIVAPKKVSRWHNPVIAHQQHIQMTREIVALLDAGQLTKAAASTHISSMMSWAGVR